MRRCVCVAAALLQCLVAQGGAQQPPQAPGTIRSGITVVPLDVRVIDGRGNPVTDLTRDDFIVLEDERPQTIQHFSTHALTADRALAAASRLVPGVALPGIEPANRRVFLVMLGRGRHQAVVRGVEALEEFVRERLLPQDRIALLAWNRATDFTTDHAGILRAVQQYRQRHERIETRMREWFSGLRAVYGSKEIPAHIQQDIDAVFAVATSAREVIPGEIADGARLAKDQRDNQQALLTNKIASERDADAKFLPDLGAERTGDMLGVEFEDYIAQSVETWQDLGGLYAGIEYMRHLDGEKHLVLFTAEGLRLERREDNVALAAAASDARITLNTIHTGGLVGAPAPRVNPRGGFSMSPVPTSAALFNQRTAVQDLRLVAALTGGRASAFAYGDKALDRIDRTSRFQYLIGYSPVNSAYDGNFRKVEVKVKRPGLTVLHRHGYYATRREAPRDRQQFIRATRIAAAASYGAAIQDIALTVEVAQLTGEGEERQLELQLRLPLTRLKFTKDGVNESAKLDLALFLADGEKRFVRDVRRPITLTVNEAARAAWAASGAPVRITAAVPREVEHVKIVVYDNDADLLGSTVAKVKR